MYYFFFIIITIILCYIYNYNTILLLIAIIHVFISIIISYILMDQIVLFKWINNTNNGTNINNIEETNSKFEISSFTSYYWLLNGLLIIFIISMIIINRNKTILQK